MQKRIGQTNPAHTGCTLAAPSPSGAVAATVTPGRGGATVLAKSITAPSRSGAAVSGESMRAAPPAARGAALARTGIALDALLGVAAGLFLLAIAALLIGRRPRQLA